MPTWLQVLSIFGASAIIPSLFKIFENIIYKKSKEKQDIEELISDVKLIKLATDDLQNSNDTLKKGVQSILKFRLREQGLKYIHQKYCTLQQKDDFSHMYTAYHNLGKNGVMDEIYNEVMALPIESYKETKGE